MEENLAAEARERLREARERGEPFDRAWSAALASLPLDEELRVQATGRRREVACWREALRWARPAFEAAYRHAPALGAEAAARGLEELVAA